jgi:hypothetical protein
MKKTLIYISVVMLALVFVQLGCKKNDVGTGTPVVTSVRSIDSTKRDSTFTSAVPGSLIVIQGSNFTGLQAVYFNDTLAYFNPAYVTDTHIILTIPGSSQTAAANPNVPNVIRIVTDHGTTTFSFTLYLYPPSISSISFDNSGTLVYIKGFNFQGIKKITFPVPGTADTALSYTVNETFTEIAAVIPPGSAFNDSLRVYCTFGVGAYSYPPPMSITSVSNENATAGSTITLSGTNFIGISSVIFPGGIAGTELQVLGVNKLTVKVPAGITAPDSLKISGLLGTATAPQLFDSYLTYTSPGYLSTFDQQWAGDNTSFVGLTGGYADAGASATAYPTATGGTGVLFQQSGMGANAAAGSQGNAGLLQLNEVPWVSDLSAAVSDYSLKFEVYTKTPWSKGQIWIALGGWYGWNSYTARYAPYTADNAFVSGGWVTATIPLSQFIKGNEFWQSSWNPAGASATRFSDFPSTALGFLIVNDQAVAVPANDLNIAIDNVRIVKGK